MITDVIDDFYQIVDLDKQNITINLIGIDPELKYFRSIFKNREELIDSIRILHQKFISDGLIKEQKIEQSIKFFKEHGDELLCKTLNLKLGRQKNEQSFVITKFKTIDDDKTIPCVIEFNKIAESDDISINDCIAMVADLKLCLSINNWIFTISIAKCWYNNEYKNNLAIRKLLSIPEKCGSKKLTIHRLKEIKTKLLNGEYTSDKLTPDKFSKEMPYSYGDVIKMNVEFSSTKNYFNVQMLNQALKLLENSLIDTCHTGPQNIYIKIASILKLPNLAKYQSGEFGIKQLTARVVTLDHDILHKELIPNMINYVVAEKTNGLTSTVLIEGKEIFISCGQVVYKFDLISPPVLPEQKTIEAIGLSKIDINNTWIFDAETIIDENNIITIYPFDIRMASSINIDNINFRYRMLFMTGLTSLKANKVVIKMKRWKRFNDMKFSEGKPLGLIEQKSNDLLCGQKSQNLEGYIFEYLDSLSFTISMYYANKIWKWKTSNTIDFLIQNCPETFKGKFPYISYGKNLYVLCCGLSKSIHQTLPNIKVEQSLIPHTANEYFPAIFSPCDKPYAHLFWSDQANLAGEIGEFAFNIATNVWELIRIRSDRKIEVSRGNYFGNDHKTAETNWFIINNPITTDHLNQSVYVNPFASKSKFIINIYENLVKHVLVHNNETIMNICPITAFECFNKFTSVIYVFNNVIESNRFIKERYELDKKRIRLNSYYAMGKLEEIKQKIEANNIPMSKNGVDNLILMYSINRVDGTPGFDSIYQGIKTIAIYEQLINKNGKIIIVTNEPNGTSHPLNGKPYNIEIIEKSFKSCSFNKILDIPIKQWVYLPDNDLYESSRILIFSKAKSSLQI